MSPRPQSPTDAPPTRPTDPNETPKAEKPSPPTGPKAGKKKSGAARHLITLGVVLLIVGGALSWKYHFKDRLVAKRFGVVEKGQIYRSGQISTHLIEGVLKDNDIAMVVDLTGEHNGSEDEQKTNRFEVETCQKLGIEHHRFPMSGSGIGHIEKAYAQALLKIHEATKAGKPVLVHCAAGSQRTGGVVAYYRLLVQKRDPQQVKDEMVSYDWDPVKDKRLHEFINQNMSRLAEELKRLGVIDQIPDPLPKLP